MQCPETPQLSTKHTLASPSYIISDTDPPKRNVNQDKIVQVCPPDRVDAEYAEIASNRAEEPMADRHQIARTTISSRNFSKPFKRSQQIDNAFDSRSNSSAAALQFHAAARRLALSPLSQDAHNQDVSSRVSKEDKSENSMAVQAVRVAPSNDTTNHMHHSDNQSAVERDITSARKDLLHNHLYTCRDSSPSVSPFRPSYGSPIPFDPMKSQRRRTKMPPNARNFSKARVVSKLSPAQPQSKTRARNFSRPARPPQPARLSVLHTCTPTKTSSSANPLLPPNLLHEVDRLDYVSDVPALETTPIASTQDVSDSKSRLEVNCISRNDAEQAQERLCDAQSAHSSTRDSFESAVSDCLGDKRLQLSSWEIWLQRIVFALFIFLANIGLGLAYLGSFKHPYILPILVFMKSKDVLSTAANLLGLLHNFLRHLVWPPKKPDPRWILSLVCAYAETEEQILKTVFSLARGDTRPHKQVICIILDGKPRDILSKMSSVNVTVQRPYTTWRGNRGEITVNAGQLEGIPLIVVAKTKNAGKKDSLILGHDLFNYPRKDMPQSTQLLRREMWQTVLPAVVPRTKRGFEQFDFIFCTDADSTIHDHALQRLANALCRENDAIAACGVLFAEFADWKTEYHPWHLFQQFQYTYGQYVRRQAESMWGRVTCLPGCITMIVVRRETGQAVSDYARPVTEHNLFRHQVQYLGTDRRLTWCMMSQGKHLRTIFVPDAISETVVPDGVSHYLSQRRRWASNAYFNDFFYLLGPRQRLITRLFSAIDIIRLSLVYYRVFNTGYFLHGLVTHFYLIKIIPTLVVTKTPATWYLLLILIREPLLRKRLHKLLLGLCINQVMSPILSVIVFTNVIFHMGSQAWGKTGASTQGPSPGIVTASIVDTNIPPPESWTPRRLAKSVRAAIRGVTPKRRTRTLDQTAQSADHKEIVRTPAHHGYSSPSRSNPSESESTPPVSGPTQIITGKLQPGTTPVACTPIQPKQSLYSTPVTLTRRTPFHREHTQTKLKQMRDTPVRMTDDNTAALVYDH